MRNSILTKFFVGYFSFAVLGFLLITYWSTKPYLQSFAY